LFIGNDIREYFDILTGFLRLFYINWSWRRNSYRLLQRLYRVQSGHWRGLSCPQKVVSGILNEGVCRDKLFPVDHSMYSKLQNPFLDWLIWESSGGWRTERTRTRQSTKQPRLSRSLHTRMHSLLFQSVGSLAVSLVAVFPVRPFNNFSWISNLQVKWRKST
jgi:hypothetical protein